MSLSLARASPSLSLSTRDAVNEQETGRKTYHAIRGRQRHTKQTCKQPESKVHSVHTSCCRRSFQAEARLFKPSVSVCLWVTQVVARDLSSRLLLPLSPSGTQPHHATRFLTRERNTDRSHSPHVHPCSPPCGSLFCYMKRDNTQTANWRISIILPLFLPLPLFHSHSLTHSLSSTHDHPDPQPLNHDSFIRDARQRDASLSPSLSHTLLPPPRISFSLSLRLTDQARPPLHPPIVIHRSEANGQTEGRRTSKGERITSCKRACTQAEGGSEKNLPRERERESIV